MHISLSGDSSAVGVPVAVAAWLGVVVGQVAPGAASYHMVIPQQRPRQGHLDHLCGTKPALPGSKVAVSEQGRLVSGW